MKRTNRIIALALSVLLLVGCLSGIAVSAAGDPALTIKASKTEIKRGEEVTLTVSLNPNGNEVGGLEVHIPVDESAFEFVSWKYGTVGETSFSLKSANYNKSAKEMIYAGARDDSTNITKSGVLFTFIVKAKADAAIGSYAFAMTDSTFIAKNEGGGVIASYSSISKGSINVGVVVPLTGITISDTAVTLTKGQTKALSVTFNPADAGQGRTVAWSSSKTSVATVDADGVVTAVAPGSATITAKCGSYSKTCKVTVVSPLEGISLNKTEVTLAKGKTETLSVTYNPADTTDSKTVTWTSSDKNVATVSSSGKITAKGGGTCVITAKVGDFTATCNVTVNVAMTGISLNKTSATLGKNDSLQLEVTYKPSDTTDDKTVAWASDNEAVATVDATGKVTTYTTGKATITATVGSYTAKCVITVEAIITDFTLSQASANMNKGDTLQLSVSNIIPEDTHEDKTVTWKSSNTKVATVDSTGKVTAVKGGKATITAKVGKVSKTCEIVVVVPLESISISKQTLDLNVSKTATLTWSPNPSNTTDELGEAVWASDNTAVATVADGKVTGVSAGSAVITVTVNGKTAQCVVTVTDIEITGIAFSVADSDTCSMGKSGLKIKPGTSTKLGAAFLPNDYTVQPGSISYVSSDESIVTVDDQGNVTALVLGKATITATMDGISVEIAVNVTESVTPETGDTSLTGAFLLLAVLSMMGVAVTCLYIFRRRYDAR